MSGEVIVALITAVTTSVVGPIAVHYITAMISPKKKDALSEAIEVNTIITEKLETVRLEASADRIWLLQFHNGGHFYPTGKSIQKFSMVYELSCTDSIPCQTQFQNIPVSLFSKQINNLHKGHIAVVPDTEIDEMQYHGITSVISSLGIKSTYVFPIYNIKNDFVGIVGVDYDKEKRNLDSVEINDLALEISTIGGVLNNYLNN
jgi:hypothetical protein